MHPGRPNLASPASSRSARLRWPALALLLILLVVPRPGAAVESSRDGVVAAASPYAAQIGAEVLARGGNAVDAAVATAFALTVAEPGMSGLGGRTVLLMGSPGGKVEGLDGATRWPAKWVALRKAGEKVPPPKGWGQVATPGTLGALVEANRRWGSLPLAELIRPAIYLARDGFLVSPIQERMFAARNWQADDPALRAVFLHVDGSPYRAGERLRQPDLARTLARIAREGADLFYRGEIAAAIGKQAAEHGGYVTAEDLAGYHPRPAPVDEIPYGEQRIASMEGPASGRTLLWRMRVLRLMPRYGDRVDDAQALAELLAAVPPKGPAGESDAAERRRLIEGDSVHAAADRIAARVTARRAAAPPRLISLPVTNTTHMVTADAEGRVVSLTQTLGQFFGPGVLLPGYGITFAGSMGYLRDDDVSKEPSSSIVPTIVFDAGGRPVVGVGGAGAARIPGAVLEVLHGVLDRGLALEAAVAAPRLIWDRDAGASVLRLEGMTTPEGQALQTALRERGFDPQPPPKDEPLARVHGCMRVAEGWTGAADPRGFGAAVTPVLLPARPQKGAITRPLAALPTFVR